MSLLLFNKPYGVITQFSAEGNKRTLKDFIPAPNVYPAGRLDSDSEGLLLLTDDGALQKRISDPKHKLPKIYWVQVEGLPGDDDLRRATFDYERAWVSPHDHARAGQRRFLQFALDHTRIGIST